MTVCTNGSSCPTGSFSHLIKYITPYFLARHFQISNCSPCMHATFSSSSNEIVSIFFSLNQSSAAYASVLLLSVYSLYFSLLVIAVHDHCLSSISSATHAHYHFAQPNSLFGVVEYGCIILGTAITRCDSNIAACNREVSRAKRRCTHQSTVLSCYEGTVF